ncbi:YcxB family protein [Paenibacillus sp. S150]|uniref:YcxB family protein n=1 Tax=Paenibacillus sp. S150 TaxID=2749826 RepID=UPI001C577D4A|nr:YcxB family protein [Paenibacillus sp. S150]MBW4081227.1 YcxB family protein [Paenibacillus sp. S150]
MEKISFHYGEHITKVARAVYFNSWKSRLAIALQAVFVVLSLILYANSGSIILLGISIALLLTMAMSIVTRTLLVPRILSADKRYSKEFEYLFDAEGIELGPEAADSKVKWGFFSRVWENKGYYLLFLSKTEYWFIAKRSFEDAAQENQFRAYVSAHQKIVSGVIR